MNTPAISTLIVDDEAPARALLRKLVSEDPALRIVGECGDGVAAVEAIESLRPDLVLLDIEMPELDGFGVLRALDPEHTPAFIFITAYDQYAVKAFDNHAIDYLLKPFDASRFALALSRAKARLRDRGVASIPGALERLLGENGASRNERILVRTQDKLQLLRAADIAWIEVDGNYVTLHAGAARFQLRQTLDTLERQLDPARFRKIQRSVLVNLDFVRELSPLTRGDYLLILRDGTELKLNRNYREAFGQFPGARL